MSWLGLMMNLTINRVLFSTRWCPTIKRRPPGNIRDIMLVKDVGYALDWMNCNWLPVLLLYLLLVVVISMPEGLGHSDGGEVLHFGPYRQSPEKWASSLRHFCDFTEDLLPFEGSRGTVRLYTYY